MIHDYFSRPSGDMFYFLGLLFADGCVHGKRVHLGLVETDSVLLVRFLEAVESKNKLYDGRSSVKNAAPFKKLTLCSEKMVSDLAKYGVVPRKTFLDLSFPNIPSKYLSHFVRGYFDGDGSLFKTGQGYWKISIVGSERFLYGMQEALEGIGRGSVQNHAKSLCAFYLNYGNKESISAIIDFLYADANVCLNRKQALAKAAKAEIDQKLLHKGIGRHGKYWRVRLGGKCLGEFKTFEEAVERKQKYLSGK